MSKLNGVYIFYYNFAYSKNSDGEMFTVVCMLLRTPLYVVDKKNKEMWYIHEQPNLVGLT